MFESMIANSEEFYKSLGIPYRVVAIVSGALSKFLTWLTGSADMSGLLLTAK